MTESELRDRIEELRRAERTLRFEMWLWICLGAIALAMLLLALLGAFRTAQAETAAQESYELRFEPKAEGWTVHSEGLTIWLDEGNNILRMQGIYTVGMGDEHEFGDSYDYAVEHVLNHWEKRDYIGLQRILQGKTESVSQQLPGGLILYPNGSVHVTGHKGITPVAHWSSSTKNDGKRHTALKDAPEKQTEPTKTISIPATLGLLGFGLWLLYINRRRG